MSQIMGTDVPIYACSFEGFFETVADSFPRSAVRSWEYERAHLPIDKAPPSLLLSSEGMADLRTHGDMTCLAVLAISNSNQTAVEIHVSPFQRKQLSSTKSCLQ